jgi:hypothetical protein
MAVLEQLERLSDERFLSLYESLTDHGFGPLDGEVAKALKFRPQAIKKLPLAKRASHARRILLRDSNAELCYELFGTYLLRGKKELVTGFLDATGVPHEEGMLSDTERTPDPGKLEAAVSSLDEKFEPEDVTLYLAMCVEQWPQMPALQGMWQERSGAG